MEAGASAAFPFFAARESIAAWYASGLRLIVFDRLKHFSL